MNKEGEESFLSIYPTRNVLKRQILIDSIEFIAICRSLFISFDDMSNAHIRGCYCLVRDSDYRVFLLIFYKTSSCPCINSILWFRFCGIPCIALDRDGVSIKFCVF